MGGFDRVDKKINLFLLTDCLNSFQGGAERQIRELVKNLDRQKFEVHVGCLSRDDRVLKELEEFHVSTVSFTVDRIYGARGIAQGLRLRKFLKEKKVDVLMTYHFGSDIWGAIFGALAKVPVIISNRRDAGFWRNRWHVLAYRLVNGLVHKIIVVSKAVKEVVIRDEKVKNEKIQVIYNGIDLSRFNGTGPGLSKRELFNVPEGAKIVGCVGNIRPVKGHKYLIEAAGLIKARVPEAHFIFIGGILQGQNKYEQSLQNLIEKKNIESCVHFLGRRTDIPEVLKLVDICVLPSLSEGLSNALLEYMAAGKAIVASRAGGNPELIIDQENGILVNQASVEELVEKLLWLLENDDECIRLGKRAQQDVKRKFSIGNMVKEYEKLMNEQLFSVKGV